MYVSVSLDYINIVLCLVLIGRQAFRLTQCLPSKSMATALLSLPQVGQHSLTFVCKALGPPVLKWDLLVSLDQMAAGRGELDHEYASVVSLSWLCVIQRGFG
jgi:hypothetical protein